MKNGRESEIIFLTAYDGQNDNGLTKIYSSWFNQYFDTG